MDNELSCPVCGEPFNGDSYKPLMINCGHTQCLSCLTTLYRAGDMHCPECRADIYYSKVSDIPINFVVVRMVNKGDSLGIGILQNIKDRLAAKYTDLKSSIKNAQSKIIFHENQVSHYNKVIDEYNKQFEQMEEWMTTFRTIETKLKSASSTQRLAEAALQVSESFQVIGEFLCKEMELEPVEAIETTSTKTDCDLQSMNLTFNDANKFYACLEEGSSRRWSRISLHDDFIHLHVLQTTLPPTGAHILKFDDVKRKIPSDSTLAFFEIWWNGCSQGFVYFRTFNCYLTRQFLKLCSGEDGPSYKDTCFYAAGNVGKPGERIQGGDYINNTGEHNQFDERVGEEILEDVPITAGLLTNYGSKFKIFLSEWPNRTDCLSHGHVEKGLALLREAARHDPITDVIVKDCGLVFKAN